MPPSARQPWLLCLAAAAAIAPACGGSRDAADVVVSWQVEPDRPAPDAPTTTTIVVRDAAGHPIAGARLRLEAHMAHPGMAPVLAELTEGNPGVYGARVTLSMAGAWTLVADGTLPDGRRLTRTLALTAEGAHGASP
jgi:hypothetical protein